jgi:hypothetical protein
MKSTRWARGILVLAVSVAGAWAQQPAKKPPAEAIRGTITSTQSMIEAVLGENRPARWHGITFRLKEYPQRQFVFHSPSFQHEGRSLVDDLRGTQVEVTCKSPATQKTCRVATLKWLSPPPPPAAKKKP